ncbi:MazF family transcriptional regulator [Cupriavidus sp. UYMU48A]|nr:MazF family transcriptional regulator [Cupriavidus sp. UYMU48A]
MNLRVVKWGNSLAVRLPARCVRHLGLKVGDQVQANLAVDGSITIRTVKWDRVAFARELASMRERMPMTESVLDELRRRARY